MLSRPDGLSTNSPDGDAAASASAAASALACKLLLLLLVASAAVVAAADAALRGSAGGCAAAGTDTAREHSTCGRRGDQTTHTYTHAHLAAGTHLLWWGGFEADHTCD